jgi:hydroxyacylglutathione hydrolase
MLHIKSIPAFNDNYIWLIENSDGRCAVVDPGDALPVLAYLKQHDKTLESILITHHHADHIGGIATLKREFSDMTIMGPAAESIPSVTHPLQGSDQINLFGVPFRILDLPGHTKGHIGYFGQQSLFCGDVLFSGGCGRIFEGMFAPMFDSLNQIASLPDDTQIYAAHEYTQSNLAFALAVEPDNTQLFDYNERVTQRRLENKPTLPTQLGTEKRINPFLRVSEPSVVNAVKNRSAGNTPLAVFTALREWKNTF